MIRSKQEQSNNANNAELFFSANECLIILNIYFVFRIVTHPIFTISLNNVRFDI